MVWFEFVHFINLEDFIVLKKKDIKNSFSYYSGIIYVVDTH